MLLNIPGTFNMRDLGGLYGENQRPLEYHRLIRGGFLSNVMSEGIAQLKTYGIKTVIDLRSSTEVQKFPDPLDAKLEYLNIPIFNQYAPENSQSADEINKRYATDSQAGYEQMLKSYRRMVIDQYAIAAFGTFFETLLRAQPGDGFLFHCSAGKDRTGICAFLLLATLGVNQHDNISNYLASNEFSKERIEWRITEAQQMRLGPKFVQSVEDLVTVKSDYLEQAISLMDYEFGGVSKFITDVIGLENGDIKRLRELFLISE